VKHPRWDLQPAVTKLLPEQQEHLIAMLQQVGFERTGKDVFEAFFPILPFVPSEQAVVKEINGVRHVLMWHRDDVFYRGYHLPGGYLLRGESYLEWCGRVLKKETGLLIKKAELIRTFNTRPETGWVPNQQIAHFFLCTVEGEPTHGQFFPITQVPQNTLGHHKKYVEEYLRAFFLRRETMRQGGIWNDGLYVAPEWNWLVVASNEKWEKSEVVFDTLDKALAQVDLHRQTTGLAVLYDDLGHEIVQSGY